MDVRRMGLKTPAGFGAGPQGFGGVPGGSRRGTGERNAGLRSLGVVPDGPRRGVGERGESMALVCPLFSGSRGNSYFVGTKQAGVLVDAGRSAKQMGEMLARAGIDPLAIQGILVTHEHGDHVKGVRVFARKYRTPVFASKGTLRAMAEKWTDFPTCEMPRALQLAGLTICGFHTSHDCAEALGYRIRTPEDGVVCVATDTGFLSEEVRESLYGADFVVLESNHDLDMLRTGPYPYHLKRRILSDQGHLSNADCAAFLPRLARSGTTRFLLAHLSEENNTQTLALETAREALVRAGLSQGTDFLLGVAKAANDSGRSIFF